MFIAEQARGKLASGDALALRPKVELSANGQLMKEKQKKFSRC
ncbi:hypothetical protein HMPREF0758_4543 [Serratia odorifera DSM 4582]|uniref:Uncharacterized protein n=1 Tax=Serratia odorifera DSM 4582 TaxID=667129 RepID=D4E8P3_SEROD|nr:hypothetical protein HMPREF0758_4543 [Serratia odorifera DSM 4582]